MPTNANTFNSRVTSEALEAKFRNVFPAQGGAELVQDLFASGVIQPVVDFSSVAEGSVLPVNLQTAWDFATGSQTTNLSTDTLINNSGFWKVDLSWAAESTGNATGKLYITNGLTNVEIWQTYSPTGTIGALEQSFVVFLRSGDSLVANSNDGSLYITSWWRQIADVNGNLVNPLGFTFS